MRRIAVIGAGRVGCTLGSRWADGGHAVVYGVRDPADPRHVDLGGRVASAAEAVADADVVLVALPWDVALDVARTLPPLGAAVVLDATNPRIGGAQDGPSGAEQLAAALDGGRIVKAFNTVGTDVMADPGAVAEAPTMWLAGDDADAVEVAAGLACELGFTPVVAGGLAAAIDLEHVAALWVRLAMRLGHGRRIAITLQGAG